MKNIKKGYQEKIQIYLTYHYKNVKYSSHNIEQRLFRALVYPVVVSSVVDVIISHTSGTVEDDDDDEYCSIQIIVQ